MTKNVKKNIIRMLVFILIVSLTLTAVAEMYERENRTGDRPQDLGDAPWGVRIAAVSLTGGRDWAKFGAADNATADFDIAWDEPEPPAPPFAPVIQAYFSYQGFPSSLNVSYLHTSASLMWRLILFVAVPEDINLTNITLEWNATDTGLVPGEYYLALHTSTEDINMRKKYNYTFSATTGEYEFNITSVIDVTPPEITPVTDYPDPQEIGGYVNITATVIDNTEVDEVHLYILYPDLTVENLSITQNRTGDTYYCNKTYHQLGNYTYHIWTNDINGYDNTSGTYSFSIQNKSSPEYRNQGQNKTFIKPGENISLYAQGRDNIALAWAWIATNETGMWQNISGQYGSPMKLIENDDWQWVNFTWQNLSISAGTIVGWSIYFMDISGNINKTDIMIFKITDKIHIKNLQTKWNFVSLPFNQSVDKTNLLVKYNGSEYTWQDAVNQSIVLGFIYEWNRTGQNYELTDTLVPGEGYWMYAYHDCELWANGIGGFASDPYITDLYPKWNIMGVPDSEPVEKQNLTILYNGTVYSWQEAVTNNIILGFIYLWDETGQSYQLTDILQPGDSYWMYAYYNCTLYRP